MGIGQDDGRVKRMDSLSPYLLEAMTEVSLPSVKRVYKCVQSLRACLGKVGLSRSSAVRVQLQVTGKIPNGQNL